MFGWSNESNSECREHTESWNQCYDKADCVFQGLWCWVIGECKTVLGSGLENARQLLAKHRDSFWCEWGTPDWL